MMVLQPDWMPINFGIGILGGTLSAVETLYVDHHSIVVFRLRFTIGQSGYG
jgi:hypothetical protein